MRLEGLAPFGAPVFVLAARPGSAVLLLPRETAVARGTSALELLDAVVGVALTPQDLLAIVSGCGVADWKVSGGATFSGGWTRLDLDQARALWLRSGADGHAAARCGAGQPMADRVHADERGMADRHPPAAVRLRRHGEPNRCGPGAGSAGVDGGASRRCAGRRRSRGRSRIDRCRLAPQSQPDGALTWPMRETCWPGLGEPARRRGPRRPPPRSTSICACEACAPTATTCSPRCCSPSRLPTH